MYDALIEAGASERTSRAAAEALSAYDNKFAAIDHRFDALEAKIDLRFAESKGGRDNKFVEPDNPVDQGFADLLASFDRLDAQLTFRQWQLALLMAGVGWLVIRAFFIDSH